MTDDASELVARLEARVEQSSRVQVFGWIGGAIERGFVIRLREIERALVGHDRSQSAVQRHELREFKSNVGGRDRRRLERAVEQFFDDLKVAASLDEFNDPGSKAIGDLSVPYEQQLLVGRLLVGEDRLDSATRSLLAAVSTAEEMAMVETLMSFRLSSLRSPAALEGLLATALGAFEDLLMPLVRLALMTTLEFTGDTHDDSDYLIALNKRARKFIAGGPNEWAPAIQRLCSFDPRSLVADWDGLVEAHQRRNALIHNGGRADSGYLRNLPASCRRPQVGELLHIDVPYLKDVIYSLRALGSGLALLWPTFFAPEDEETGLDRSNSLVYDLLLAGRWADAHKVGTVFIRYERDDQQAALLQVNTWLARRELTDEASWLRAEISMWTPPDDSPRWQLAVALLLRDDAGTRDALRASDAQGIPKKTYANWPLVQLSDSSIRAQIHGRPEPIGSSHQPHKGRRRRTR
jgi:hypothetical protein